VPGRLHQLSSTIALLGGLLSASGCERDPVTDGSVSEDDLPAAGLVPSGGWESAPFPTPRQCSDNDAGAMLAEEMTWPRLAGRKTLEIPHGLERIPSVVLVYVAFDERGCGGALAAGDIARIKGVGRNRVIIENATTEHFFLRLYLQ